MISRQRVLISVIITAIFIFGITSTQAGETDLVSRLNLTKEQTSKLDPLIDEFIIKALDIQSKLDNISMQIDRELKREDRFDTKSKSRAGAEKVNNLIKKISPLYGDLLRLRVEYLFKAKDVFTERQKAIVIDALLDFDIDLPDNYSYYMELRVDLTRDQLKKLLKYRADMDIKDIKLGLAMDNNRIDLQDEIYAEVRDSQKVNKIMVAIINLGTSRLENRVNHILKAKDVLTVEQKKELVHNLLMMSND